MARSTISRSAREFDARSLTGQLHSARLIGWVAFAALILGSNWHDGWPQSSAVTVVLDWLAFSALVVEILQRRVKVARSTAIYRRLRLLLGWLGALLSYTAATGFLVVSGRSIQIAGCAFLMWLVVSRKMSAVEDDHALLELTSLWVALALSWLIRANDTPLVAIIALGFVGGVLAMAVRRLNWAARDDATQTVNPAKTVAPSSPPAEPSWAAQDSVLHDLSNAMTASLFIVRDLSRALDKGTEPSLGRARSLSQALVKELSQISEHIRTSRQSVRLQHIAGVSVLLREPIERCVELVSGLYPKSHCRVECEPSAMEAAVSMIGGEATLTRIVENLLLNACQAQTGGSKKRKVVCRIAVVDDTVTLSVEDNGPGFSNVILDSFPNPSISTKPQGTGIGLYSCHQLVKRDRGTLALSNSNDGGARVIITWPGLAISPDSAVHGESEISISGTRPRIEHVISEPSMVAHKP